MPPLLHPTHSPLAPAYRSPNQPGIFVNDILEAVPIDKYFELFKPNAGGEGGYMRIGMNFVKDLKQAKASKEAMKSVSSPLPAMGAPSSAGAAKKK